MHSSWVEGDEGRRIKLPLNALGGGELRSTTPALSTMKTAFDSF